MAKCEHNRMEYFGMKRLIACVDCGKHWQYNSMDNYFVPINEGV